MTPPPLCVNCQSHYKHSNIFLVQSLQLGRGECKELQVVKIGNKSTWKYFPVITRKERERERERENLSRHICPTFQQNWQTDNPAGQQTRDYPLTVCLKLIFAAERTHIKSWSSLRIGLWLWALHSWAQVLTFSLQRWREGVRWFCSVLFCCLLYIHTSTEQSLHCYRVTRPRQKITTTNCTVSVQTSFIDSHKEKIFFSSFDC